MRLTPVCEQKGLRTYVIAKPGKDRRVRYRATLTTDDSSLDVPVFIEGNAGYIISILPSLSVNASSQIEIKERHTGRTIDIVDLSYAELLAKISRRAPQKVNLLRLVNEVDTQNPLHRGQYDMNLDDCFDTFDGDVVWRIAVDWRGSLKSKPRLELVGRDLEKIEADIHEFEFQEGLFREGFTVNRLIATFRIPRNLADFCLFAHDPQREVTSNFYPMDSMAADGVINERTTSTQSVDDQQEIYPAWLDAHLEKLAKAESERHEILECKLHVIVFDEKGSEDALGRTLGSLEQQNCNGWQATVLSHVTAAPSKLDTRINMIGLSNDDSLSSTVKNIARETAASHICLIHAGDTFATGAFIAIANASVGSDAVIAFDEDFVDGNSARSHPRFKGPLNKQLEYTENWMGYGALFPATLFANTTLNDLDSPSLMAYALALSAMEKGLSFDFLPSALLHTSLDASEGDRPMNLGFLPNEIDAAKRLLAQHLDAIGARASVQDGLLSGTLKISLGDAGQGKVSIVIPTMDHADMLERCVSSILERATYQDIEIVLVENNSKEPETFALYDRLKEEYPDIVKVVTWEGPFNYSGIINFGVAASSGKFLLLLNNDTEVIVPSFIEEMLALATIPEVGVVGAKLYFNDMLVQHAGMLIGPYGGISHVNQNFSDIRPGYQNRALTTCSFSSVTGACQMVRREVFEEVDGYDEAFVVGFNDADFCLKARAAGYDVVFTPYAELYHYEFVSRGREAINDEKQTRWESERDAFFSKWETELQEGDPLTNPNLDKDNWYYALPTQ